MRADVGDPEVPSRGLRWGATLLFGGFLASGVFLATLARGATSLLFRGAVAFAMAVGVTGGLVLLSGDLGEALDWWTSRPLVLRAPEAAATLILPISWISGGSAPLYIRGLLFVTALGLVLLAVAVLGSLVDLVETSGPRWGMLALSIALASAGIAVSASFVLQPLLPERWWIPIRSLVRTFALAVPLGLVVSMLGETTIRAWSKGPT